MKSSFKISAIFVQYEKFVGWTCKCDKYEEKKKEIKKGANTFYVIKVKAEHKRDGFTKIKQEVTNWTLR